MRKRGYSVIMGRDTEWGFPYLCACSHLFHSVDYSNGSPPPRARARAYIFFLDPLMVSL